MSSKDHNRTVKTSTDRNRVRIQHCLVFSYYGCVIVRNGLLINIHHQLRLLESQRKRRILQLPSVDSPARDAKSYSSDTNKCVIIISDRF